MSTLVTQHNGMDRVLRGLEVVVQGVYGGLVDARNAAARQGAHEVTKSVEAPRTLAKPSLFARLSADMARRRADREFEALMKADPRLRAEFMAARARAEWN